MGKIYIGQNLLADTKETMLAAASDVGAVFMWGSNTPPKGCLLCDGAAYSRMEYSQLFNVIGTTYGAGDGSTTFNVPDMRGKVAAGRDAEQAEFDVLNESGGEKVHTLTASEIPPLSVTTKNGDAIGWWQFSGAGGSQNFVVVGGAMGDVKANAYGGGGAHNNLQPYRVFNFVIRYLPSLNEKTNLGDTLPLGTMIEYPSDTMPMNWLLCNGQAVSRTDYTELFAVISTLYGAGDGSTTFNLPDMRGRVAVGKDTTQTEFDMLNNPTNYKGEKVHLNTVAESGLRGHTHVLPLGTTYSSSGIGDVAARANENGTKDTNFRTGDVAAATTYGSTVLVSGDSAILAHNNLQPYRVLNYIIKAKYTVPIDAVVEDSLTSTSTKNALSAKQGKELADRTADSGWITPALLNGWANYGLDNHAVAGYRKEGKHVTIKGLVMNGTSGSAIFNLPAGFRPSEILIFCAMTNDGVARIDVRPDGDVISYYGGNNFQSLSQISYFID